VEFAAVTRIQSGKLRNTGQHLFQTDPAADGEQPDPNRKQDRAAWLRNKDERFTRSRDGGELD
jgi:hypothetical protein